MRQATSCYSCRTAKRKCYSNEGITGCVPCQEREIECSFCKNLVQPGRSLAPGSEKFEHATRGLVADLYDSDLATFVTDYLDVIHDKSHSLFHKSTLWSTIRAGTISKSLLYSICAMGSRISLDERRRDCGRKCFLEAKKLFHADFGDVSLENIQTAILIANLSAFEMDTASEALFFSVAIRSATILSLHVEDVQDSVILKEIKCRTWCSLIMADRWVSSGLNLPFMIPISTVIANLPMDEFTFQCLPPEYNNQDLVKEPGLWALKLSLTDIFARIQEMNRDLVQGTANENSYASNLISLADRLRVWEDNLHPRAKFTSENLDFHCERANGGTFVCLHLGYHHYSTLLYYHSLERHHYLGVNNNFKAYALRCKFHASSYATILRSSRNIAKCRIMHITAGHMTVISSSVLLHTLLFGSEAEVAEARVDLVSNFDTLLDLQGYWPSLSKAIERLFTFQNACIWSANMNAYKIDKWMLRFLLEYSLPLETRNENSDIEVPSPNAIQNQAFSDEVNQNLAARSLIVDDELRRFFGVPDLSDSIPNRN